MIRSARASRRGVIGIQHEVRDLRIEAVPLVQGSTDPSGPIGIGPWPVVAPGRARRDRPGRDPQPDDEAAVRHLGPRLRIDDRAARRRDDRWRRHGQRG